MTRERRGWGRDDGIERPFELDWCHPDGSIKSPIAHWPRWAQAGVSLALTYAWVYESFLKPPPEPGAPQQAFILTLVLLAAVFIASELLRPKPKIESERPKNLGDFRVSTATQGRPVPLIFGTVLQEGPNVIWYGDLIQEAIREKIKTGLFSSTTVTKGFRYRLGLQFGICRGQTGSSTEGSVELRRILVGDKEAFSGSLTGETSTVINEPDFFGGEDLGAGGLVGTLRWKPGTQAQAKADYLDDFQDVDPPNLEVPRYIGTCYALFEQGLVGTSTNLEQWKFEVRRITNGLSLAGNGSVNSGNDMNPMNVLYELLTDTEWGLRQAVSDIDTAALTTAATTLASEGNGMSMIIDNGIEGLELLNEIERQVDGFVFQDPETGLWTIKLARDDYVVGNLPVLDESNLVEIADYSQGTWEETINQVRCSFANRANDYADDYGVAFDGANAQIQGGGTTVLVRNVPVTNNYPGVKDGALASQIASRDIRGLSTPLAKANFKLTRDLYNLKPGDPFVWNDTARGISTLVMRVQRIDYGTLTDGVLTIDAIQDVFRSQVGSFGTPPPTGWTPPQDVLVAFPADEQIAIEAPRGLRFRDPDLSGVPSQAKIWAAARRQRSEVEFRLTERNAAGAPSGAFNDRGAVQGFMLIGTLAADLASGTGVGTTTFVINSTPDTQLLLEGAFVDNPDLAEKGTDLLNMILIDDEFMLVGNAANEAANVRLNNVHRGVLDSAQVAHSSGADVYVVINGAGLADNVISPTNMVDVRLLPRSLSDTLPSASANTISFTMDRRLNRPYCPSRVSINNGVFLSPASLDFLGGGDEATGLAVDFIRRDYRTGDGLDEIPPLSTDAASIFGDFPSANNTTTELTLRNDPDGANTLLLTDTGITGTSNDLLRIRILSLTDGVLPTRLRVELRARHDEVVPALLSRQALIFDFNVTTGLTGDFNFGARSINTTSNLYTATTAGTFNFSLSSATTVGDVQYRLNGGAWTQLIAQGGTLGSIAGVVATDTIEVRHQSTDVNLLKQLNMTAPGGGQNGYFILIP